MWQNWHSWRTICRYTEVEKNVKTSSGSAKTLEVLASRLWEYFYQKKVKETQASMVRYYRASVTTAASGGKIGVKRPFDDTESFLPYVSTMAGVSVGEQVVVLVFGEAKNAVNRLVFMYADGRNM